MAEDRVDILTAESAPYHANVEKFGLRFPVGTRFVEDLTVDPAVQRIDKSQYLDPAVLSAELQRVWKKTWQFACTVQEVAKPGDYVTYDIGDQGYVVVRQADGSLSAFHNACQHRGNRLVNGNGNIKDIRCPFHGWAWRLDGSLRAIPDRHTFDCLDGDLSLQKVHVDHWAGLVFINPDPACSVSLSEFLGPIVGQLAPYKLEDMSLVGNSVMPLSANWKTCVEAFVEVYHVNGVHPQFLPAHDDMTVAFEVLSKEFGHSRVIIPFGIPSPRLSSYRESDVVGAYVHTGGIARGTEIDLSDVAFAWDGEDSPADAGKSRKFDNARDYLIDHLAQACATRDVDVSGLTPDQYIDDWHYFIFPGLVFNISAGGYLLLSMRPHATDPDQCIIHTMLFQKLDPATAAQVPVKHQELREEGHDYGQILNQDYTNVVLTQRGMHSDGFKSSRLSRQEIRIATMQQVLRRMTAQ